MSDATDMPNVSYFRLLKDTSFPPSFFLWLLSIGQNYNRCIALLTTDVKIFLAV